MIDLSGQRILVTGAGRGIGFGCAVKLAEAGADLIINDRPGSPELPQLNEALQLAEVDCLAIEADMFSRSGCEQFMAEVLQQVDWIDGLVHVPAFSRRGDFLSYDPDLFEKTLQGTFASGFHMAQLVARQLAEQGRGGRILFISSVQAEMNFAGSFAYGAAKAALNHMTKTMAIELCPHRIAVNAIEPGWIDTPGERETFATSTIEEEGPKLPWGRIGNPVDIGCAAAFLMSEAADYITGTILPVDGGFRLKDFAASETIRPRDAAE